MKLHTLLTACAALLALVAGPGAAQTTAVPGFISYQGRVVDAAGANVGAGTPVNRTVIFRIWDSPSSTNTANLIYSEAQTVTVSEGEFSVLVGQGVANTTQTYGYIETGKKLADIGSAFGGSTRYLGVTVAATTTIATTDNEITPRQQIVSTAFAMRAKYAEQVGSNGIAALTALDSGRVGIGTLAPPALFTVSGANQSTTTSTPQLLVTADDLTERLRIGVDSSNNGTGFIQAFKEGTGVGTGVQNLLLNPNGGNVGIGNTNPAVALSVTGAITATGVITGGSLTTNAGNIGIGTTTPAYKLDVKGNGRFTDTLTADAPIVMGPGSQIYGSAVAGESKPVFWPRATDDATYLNIGSNGWYVRDDSNNVLMRLTSGSSGGRLGIGTSTPANFLQVQAPASAQTATNSVTSGNAVAAIGASDAGLHFGTYNNTNGYGSWIQSMRTWDNYSFNLVLNPNGGNVGIGTSLPGYPLSVAPKVNVAYTSAAITHNNNNFTPQLGNADGYTAGGAVGMNGQTWQTSIYAEGVVAGSAFVAMSDLRIKDIVNRSSTRNDLELINQLQVTDYRLKDSIANGTGIRKGFIAQEVRKIIPEAVSPSPGYIPDIYVLATQSVFDAAQKRLSVTLAKPHALAIGEWVRLYGDDNTMETKVLTVESATSFTVASEKPMAKAFVYGRRVDDFLTVDYDRLFTTGIGAIQDLARQLEAVQDENAALRRELAAKDASLETRLIALERKMSKEVATETVSLKTARAVK